VPSLFSSRGLFVKGFFSKSRILHDGWLAILGLFVVFRDFSHGLPLFPVSILTKPFSWKSSLILALCFFLFSLLREAYFFLFSKGIFPLIGGVWAFWRTGGWKATFFFSLKTALFPPCAPVYCWLSVLFFFLPCSEWRIFLLFSIWRQGGPLSLFSNDY